MSTSLANEIAVVVRLEQEKATDGWRFTAMLEDVPETIGHYGLQDGLRGLGCGVTLNMRKSLIEAARYKTVKRPIYSWLPDTDGSVALWLDGMYKCSRCKEESILELWQEEMHLRDAHGIKPEICECDE